MSRPIWSPISSLGNDAQISSTHALLCKHGSFRQTSLSKDHGRLFQFHEIQVYVHASIEATLNKLFSAINGSRENGNIQSSHLSFVAAAAAAICSLRVFPLHKRRCSIDVIFFFISCIVMDTCIHHTIIIITSTRKMQ